MSARRKPFRPVPAPAMVPTPLASNISEMDKRVKHLEQLYFQDGRHLPDHPHANTYTGLYANSAAAGSVDISRLQAPGSRRATRTRKAKRKK